MRRKDQGNLTPLHAVSTANGQSSRLRTRRDNPFMQCSAELAVSPSGHADPVHASKRSCARSVAIRCSTAGLHDNGRALDEDGADALRSVSSRQRMMFVHDAPPAIVFTKADGEAKRKRLAGAVRVDVDARSPRRGEGDLPAADDRHVVPIEGNRLLRPGEKRLPCRHVRVNPTRLEGRWNIEHQDLVIVVGANRRQVLFAHSLRPSGDEGANVRFVVGVVLFLCARHVVSPGWRRARRAQRQNGIW